MSTITSNIDIFNHTMPVDELKSEIETDIKDDLFLKKSTRTCRLCLSNEAKFEIFSDDLSIYNKIQGCCELEVLKDDGLPNHICTQCLDTLNLIINFKQQCHDNDGILRKNLIDASFQEEIKCEVKVEYFSDNDNNNYDGYESEEYKPEKKITKRKKPRTLSQLVKNGIKIKRKKVKKDEEVKSESEDIKTENEGEKVKRQRKMLSKSTLCPFCGKVFEKLASLNAHIKTHRTDRPFTCDICSKTFFEKWHLHEHKKIHTNVKSYPCEACGKLFKTSRDTKRHMDTVHKKIRMVQCKLCNKSLSSSSGLKLHMKSHTGEKEFQCDVCSRKFISKPCLTLHLRVHTGEKPYACRYCDGRFAILKTLKEHERIHTGETPYRCPSCGKGFSQKSNMKSHFRYNHRGVEFVS